MTNQHDALWAGRCSAKNEEARVQPGFLTNQTTNGADCADDPAMQQVVPYGDRKQFETLRARCALVGYELKLIAATGPAQVFHVSRWDASHTLIGLTVVEQFADRVGAPS